VTAFIGDYRVSRRLGWGTFGTVYLASGRVPLPSGERSEPRLVAIKQLREWSMSGFETLVREYELLGTVRHRTLCTVYEFLDRDLAVVMEYVRGVTLRQLLDALAARNETMWSDAALLMGIDLAEALYRAYASPGPRGEPLGLVHRDIKPANVMLTVDGGVKLLDFGLAATDRAADIDELGVQGTPLYMAPEQAVGDGVDHRTDLFALGLVLYELLVGRAAYPVPSVERESRIGPLLERVQRAEVDDELAVLATTHPRVKAVLARCLAGDPADRPEDGMELMRDLRRCVSAADGDPLVDYAAYVFREVCKLDPVPSVDFETEARPYMMDSTTPGDEPTTMSQNSPPRPGGAPPRPEAPRPGSGRPGPKGARPRPKASKRPKGRPPKGGKSWSPPSKEAKASAPKPPPADAGGSNEPKNLRMVPLSAEADDPELGAGKPSSATEFFALPTPRRQLDEDDEIVDLRRNDAVAAAGRPAAPPPGAPQQPAAPPPGAMPHGGHMAPGQPPPGAPMAVPMGISGPVAGGSMPPGYPMNSQPALPPDPNAELDRAKSYRVFAVVAGLMFMVFTAAVASLMVLAYGFYMLESKEPVAQNPVVQPIPPPAPRGLDDTGVDAAPPPPPPPKPRAAPSPRPKSAPRPAAPKPPPAPEPVAVGPVVIKLPPSAPFTRVEVKCDGGTRERGSVTGGTATVPNIPGPGQDSCRAVFKGGGGLPTANVAGGETYTCTFDGSFANCK